MKKNTQFWRFVAPKSPPLYWTELKKKIQNSWCFLLQNPHPCIEKILLGELFSKSNYLQIAFQRKHVLDLIWKEIKERLRLSSAPIYNRYEIEKKVLFSRKIWYGLVTVLSLLYFYEALSCWGSENSFVSIIFKLKEMDHQCNGFQCWTKIINRPCLDGAVLQTASSLSAWFLLWVIFFIQILLLYRAGCWGWTGVTSVT